MVLKAKGPDMVADEATIITQVETPDTRISGKLSQMVDRYRAANFQIHDFGEAGLVADDGENYRTIREVPNSLTSANR